MWNFCKGTDRLVGFYLVSTGYFVKEIENNFSVFATFALSYSYTCESLGERAIAVKTLRFVFVLPNFHSI